MADRGLAHAVWWEVPLVSSSLYKLALKTQYML